MINKYLQNSIDIEELVLFFDTKNYSKDQIKKGGIVYTPKYISDLIVQKLDPKENETIFEPSVGHGIFIFSLLEYMENKVSDLKSYFLNYVYGQDIESQNISELKELLVAFFHKRNIPLSISEIKNFSVGDTLTNSQSFDIIFGNPPYIKIQNLDPSYSDFLRQNFSSCKKGNIDIFFAFIEFAYLHSKRSSFIVPNSWLTSKSASSLRNIVRPRLKEIIDFKEKKIFEKADTYTSIFFIDNSVSDSFSLKIYDQEFSLDKKSSSLFSLTNDLKYPSSNVIVRFHTPIATLRDKIFIKDSSESIPFYKISRVKNEEEFLNSQQKIIFPYDKDFKIKDRLNDDAFSYLKSFKHILSLRDKGNKTYEKWYAYGRRQGFSTYDLSNDIIIIPGMINENFSFFKVDLSKINSQFLFTSGFILEVKKEDSSSVLSFLNSSSFKQFLKEKGKVWPGRDTNYYSLNITKIKELFNA
jgi:hypothetical protein